MAVILELFKLFWAHAKFFILIQLALITPLMILFSVVEFFFIEHHNLHGKSMFRCIDNVTLLPPEYVSVAHLASNFGVSFGHDWPALLHNLKVSLELTAGTIVSQLRRPTHFLLPCAPCNHTPLVVAPRFTNGYSAILMTILFIELLPFEGPIWQSVLIRFVQAINWVCLPIIFRVASRVSILEEDYGWPTVAKSLKLLKENLPMAVLFQLLWLVNVVMEIFYLVGFLLLVCNWLHFSPRAQTLAVCSIVIYLVLCNILLAVQNFVCWSPMCRSRHPMVRAFRIQFTSNEQWNGDMIALEMGVTWMCSKKAGR